MPLIKNQLYNNIYSSSLSNSTRITHKYNFLVVYPPSQTRQKISSGFTDISPELLLLMTTCIDLNKAKQIAINLQMSNEKRVSRKSNDVYLYRDKIKLFNNFFIVNQRFITPLTEFKSKLINDKNDDKVFCSPEKLTLYNSFKTILQDIREFPKLSQFNYQTNEPPKEITPISIKSDYSVSLNAIFIDHDNNHSIKRKLDLVTEKQDLISANIPDNSIQSLIYSDRVILEISDIKFGDNITSNIFLSINEAENTTSLSQQIEDDDNNQVILKDDNFSDKDVEDLNTSNNTLLDINYYHDTAVAQTEDIGDVTSDYQTENTVDMNPVSQINESNEHRQKFSSTTDEDDSLENSGGTGGNAPPPSNTEKHQLSSEIPGRIVHIYVTKGQNVLKGQELYILEMMKMQISIRAKENLTITDIFVSEGDISLSGEVLLEYESSDIS